MEDAVHLLSLQIAVKYIVIQVSILSNSANHNSS